MQLEANYTGITYTPGRTQPYTVWWEGMVVRFATTVGEARYILGKLDTVAASIEVTDSSDR